MDAREISEHHMRPSCVSDARTKSGAHAKTPHAKMTKSKKM